MLNGVRPNLGFWLADQFQSVHKWYRTLFLGPYITLLAINLCVLDLDNNDLHPACKKEFLDMSVFERIGVVEFKEGRFQFTEPGPTQLPKSFMLGVVLPLMTSLTTRLLPRQLFLLHPHHL